MSLSLLKSRQPVRETERRVFHMTGKLFVPDGAFKVAKMH